VKQDAMYPRHANLYDHSDQGWFTLSP